MNRRLLVAPVLALATPVVAVLMAGAASAHVTVNPNTATAGSYTKLTFRVPTESDTASTTKLAVFFPTDKPFASVSVKPVPGWTFKVRYHKLAQPISDDDGSVTQAVSEIVWKATSPATAIKPGEFDEFDVSVGPMPTSGTLTFKALQTYSDHSVVRWIDQSVAGQPEPDHPAPVLTITPAAAGTAGASGAATSSPGAGGSGTADSSTTGAGTTAPAADHTSSGEAKTALIVSIIALVVAAGGTGLSFVRRKQS